MSDIKINHLYKIYNAKKPNEFKALQDISFHVKSGEIAILKGVSGSGKSTLLAILAALAKPSSGEVLVDNENISKFPDLLASKYRHETIGFVYQSFNLIEALSVYDNVFAPLSLTNFSSKTCEEKIANALKIANISHKKEQIVSRLSGGEKQRVAIARALVMEPSIILADEPTANLDPANSKMFIEILKKFKDLGKTVVIATHDILFDDLEFVDNYIYIKNGILQ